MFSFHILRMDVMRAFTPQSGIFYATKWGNSCGNQLGINTDHAAFLPVLLQHARYGRDLGYKSPSSNTMNGAFPPSASDNFLMLRTDCSINKQLIPVEPINVSLHTIVLEINSPSIALALPVTTLIRSNQRLNKHSARSRFFRTMPVVRLLLRQWVVLLLPCQQWPACLSDGPS